MDVGYDSELDVVVVMEVVAEVVVDGFAIS